MPYKKSTQSLKRLSFKVVSKNILHLQNDAQHLCPVLRNELYENRQELFPLRRMTTIDRDSYRPLPANVFITTGTRHIENVAQFNHVFQVKIPVHPKIISVCRNLINLKLTYRTEIGSRELEQLVINNPKLKIINFSSTNCTNSVLAEIGKNCRNLERLNISSCGQVNDIGMHNLCNNNNMKIIELNIRRTEVSIKGCLFALKNLFRLTNISYLNKLEMINAPENYNSVLSTTVQKAWFSEIRHDDQLQRLSVAFPNLSELSINISEMTEILNLFANFTQLKRLGIIGDEAFDLNDKFRNQIRPAFRSVNNLTYLSLQKIPTVDLAVIGCSCPNLKFLLVNLNGATDQVFLNQPCPQVLFENLEYVSVTESNTREVFELLLSNCSRLKTLKVKNCLVFSDDLFGKLLELNPMKYLENIFLLQCSEITTDFLKRFMTLYNNPLRRLCISECQNIDVYDLAKFAHEQFFDIEIEDRL